MNLQFFTSPTVTVPAALLVGSSFTKEIFFPPARAGLRSDVVKRIFSGLNISLDNLQEKTRHYSPNVKHRVSAFVDNLWLTTFFWGALQKVYLGRNNMYSAEALPSTLFIILYGSALLHIVRKIGSKYIPYQPAARYIAPSFDEYSALEPHEEQRLIPPSTRSGPIQPDECDADTAILGHFIDPITQVPINEAVRRKSNTKIIFDRVSIEAYIQRMSSEGRPLLCPVTRDPISLDDLTPAYDIQGIINARIRKLREKVAIRQAAEAE